MNYLLEKTKILMDDCSIKNIEDINVGDLVITHNKTYKKVINKTVVNDKIDVIKIFGSNNEKLIFPKNNYLYSLNIFNPNWKTDVTAFRLWNEPNTIKEFKFINNFNDEFLLSPVIDNYIESDLTVDQARLLGIYAAEGSLHKRKDSFDSSVVFTFSADELNTLAKDTEQLLVNNFFGVKVSTETFDNTCRVHAYYPKIFEFFLKHVGVYSYHKKLSKELVFGSDEIKKNFIIGWLEGDGHYQKDNYRVTGTTVSPSLTYQIRNMLYSLNIHTTIRIGKPSNSIINGRKIIGKYDVYRVRIQSGNFEKLFKGINTFKFKDLEFGGKNMKKFENNFCIHTILSKEDDIYSGDLYSIEVEGDNSLIANGLVVGI